MIEPKMVTSDVAYGVLSDHTAPMLAFEPIETTISLDTGRDGFLRQAQMLTTDCVNHGGTSELSALKGAI